MNYCVFFPNNLNFSHKYDFSCHKYALFSSLNFSFFFLFPHNFDDYFKKKKTYHENIFLSRLNFSHLFVMNWQ